MSLLARFLYILLLAQAMACSLVLEPGALDEGCPKGMKPCFGKCVSEADPAFGCGQPSCAPCGLLHAASTCNAARECSVGMCTQPFLDCDKLAYNGCEVNSVEDVNHCRDCWVDCEATPRTRVRAMGCGAATCYVLACETGYVDFDADEENGCEQSASTQHEDAGTGP